jgi:hypothetical protein
MRSLRAWPAASSAALVLALAGCGGHAVSQRRPPKIPRALAATLAERADALATRLGETNSCSARPQAVALQQAALDALPRVPVRYRATLTQAVDAIAARVPACPPPPPPAPKGKKHNEHEHGHGKGHHGD